MALSPAGYQTTGTQPGTASAQGNYAPCAAPYATWNGATQYTNGSLFLTFNAGNSLWGIYFVANLNGGPQPYYYVSGGSVTNLPLTGWSIANGAAPAPTFTTISGAAPASAPRLQPRVVVF